MHRFISALAATGLVASAAAPAAAQSPAERGPATRLYALGGGVTALRAVASGAAPARFATGPAIAVGLARELTPVVALRAEGTWARTEAEGAGWPASLRDRTVTRLAAALDVQVKLPTAAGITPYAFAGAGLMHFNPAGASAASGPAFTRFAPRAGLGVEYFPGASPVGVMVQGATWYTTYDRNGFDRGQFDLAWQAGVSVRF